MIKNKIVPIKYKAAPLDISITMWNRKILSCIETIIKKLSRETTNNYVYNYEMKVWSNH